MSVSLRNKRFSVYELVETTVDGVPTKSYHLNGEWWGRLVPPSGHERTVGLGAEHQTDGLIAFADEAAPTDWTALSSNGSTADVEGGVYYWIADGTESGTIIANEGSFGVTGEEYCFHCWKVPAAAWHGTTPPEISTVQEATSGTINPPEITAGAWDGTAEDWIAFVFAVRDDDDGITALGAAYATNFQYTQSASSTGSCEIASSWRTIIGSDTENPGNATQTNTNEGLRSWTVAVRGPVEGETPVEITASPAILASTAQASTLDLGPLTIIGTSATATAQAQAATVTRDPTVITASPATLSSSAIVGLVTAGEAPVVIEASPATLSAQAQAADVQVVVVIVASPATIASSSIAAALDLTPLVIIGQPVVVVAAALPGTPKTALMIIASPATLRAQAITGVKLIPQGTVPAFYRRSQQGNRPRRIGWHRPPSHR